MSGMPYLVHRPTTLFVLLKDTEYTASAPWWCTAMFKTRIFHWSFKCSCLIVGVVYDCFSFLCFCHFMLEMLPPIIGAHYDAPLGVR